MSTEPILTDDDIRAIHDKKADLPDFVGLNRDMWPSILRFAREVEAATVRRIAEQTDCAPQQSDIPLEWQDHRDGLLAYVLQGDMHNRLTPRVVDIAYSAFMSGRSGKNKDDGGPCDWFNDTKPMVTEAIQKMRKDLFNAKPFSTRK